MTYKRNVKARSRNHCCSGKAIIITYSESVSLTLVIHHALRMRSIVWLSVACVGLSRLNLFSHKRHDF